MNNNYPTRLPDIILNQLHGNFTTVPNSMLRNPNMSWRAKGLFAQLLSNENKKWCSYVTALVKSGKESEEIVLKVLREIEENGYLLRLKYRDKTGHRKIRGSVWVCTTVPFEFNWNSIKDSLDEFEMEPLHIEKYPKLLNAANATSTPETRGVGYQGVVKQVCGKTGTNNTNNNNINIKQKKDTVSPSILWKTYFETYGKDVVVFVRWFLQEQKKRWPNFIKEAITPDCTKVRGSLKTVEQLIRIDKFTFAEMKSTLSKVPDDKFWSRQVLSLEFLRAKSTSNGETKFVNIMNTLDDAPSKKTDAKIPKDIDIQKTISTYFKKEYPAQNFTEKVYEPAVDVVHARTLEEKFVLVKTLLSTFDWFQTNQQRPESSNGGDSDMWWYEIPSPTEFVTQYIKWIQDQSWIDNKNVAIFKHTHTIFLSFFSKFQKDCGFDFFSGRCLN